MLFKWWLWADTLGKMRNKVGICSTLPPTPPTSISVDFVACNWPVFKGLSLSLEPAHHTVKDIFPFHWISIVPVTIQPQLHCITQANSFKKMKKKKKKRNSRINQFLCTFFCIYIFFLLKQRGYTEWEHATVSPIAMCEKSYKIISFLPACLLSFFLR